MKRYIVSISHHANNDMLDIARYIAFELHEPITAEKLIDKLQEDINGLSAMPARFALVTDNALAEKGIRKMPVENYIVFFKTGEYEGKVSILRVLYSKRDWINLL